jgi:hypothetical protein
MIAGIVIPGRSREPAIIAAVGIGLDDRDLSIICAARALAFVVPRDDQGERPATIKVRECRKETAAVRA